MTLFEHAGRTGLFAWRIFGNREGEGFDLIAVLVGEFGFRSDDRHDRIADADGQHLIVALQSVLYLDDRIVPFRPIHGCQIFVAFPVPLHRVRYLTVTAAIGVEAELQQCQMHVGVGRQRLRVAAGGHAHGRIRGIADVPYRLG